MSLLKLIDIHLHNVLDRYGYVLMRKANPNYYLGRRLKLMRSYCIDLVLDVGANTGQYARQIRDMGYSGEIVSFEPMRSVYEQLLRSSEEDPSWSCRNFALGDAESEHSIHVSCNSVSSSRLVMLPEHEKHAPASHVITEEKIRVKRMDTLPDWDQWKAKKGIWLKIDVQGYEDKVLSGAAGCLDEIIAIQLELSLKPLYARQLTIIPIMKQLAGLGFDPVGFEPGFSDKISGEYLQVDGIFRNRQTYK